MGRDTVYIHLMISVFRGYLLAGLALTVDFVKPVDHGLSNFIYTALYSHEGVSAMKETSPYVKSIRA